MSHSYGLNHCKPSASIKNNNMCFYEEALEAFPEAKKKQYPSFGWHHKQAMPKHVFDGNAPPFPILSNANTWRTGSLGLTVRHQWAKPL